MSAVAKPSGPRKSEIAVQSDARQRVRPLGEIVRPTRPRVDPQDMPDLPFIGMDNIESHTMKLLGTVRARDMKSSAFHFYPGDVLYGRLRPYLNKVYRPKFEGLCSAEFIVLPPPDELDGQYLQYFFNSKEFVSFACSLNTGDRPRVRFEQLADYPMPLPPLEEQKQIVAEIEKQFSCLDDAVANLKRVKANLKRYKAAVLKAAVGGRLVETEAEIGRREDRSYETGEQLLQRILEIRHSQRKGKGKYREPEPAAPDTDDLPELPEGWIWARLDAIAALKGGVTVDSKRVDSTARSVPYLRVANVQRGYLDFSEVKYIEAPESAISELRLRRGDILFNEGGDRDKLGRGWIWEEQLAECIHQNHVFRARLWADGVSPKLISWWGNSFGRDYFIREGKQTTNLASINLTKLAGLPVPIPPVVEQLRIVASVERHLSSIDACEAMLAASFNRTKAMRGKILASAFLR